MGLVPRPRFRLRALLSNTVLPWLLRLEQMPRVAPFCSSRPPDHGVAYGHPLIFLFDLGRNLHRSAGAGAGTIWNPPPCNLKQGLLCVEPPSLYLAFRSVIADKRDCGFLRSPPSPSPGSSCPIIAYAMPQFRSAVVTRLCSHCGLQSRAGIG